MTEPVASWKCDVKCLGREEKEEEKRKEKKKRKKTYLHNSLQIDPLQS